MVERPIKKSDRQSQADTDGNTSHNRPQPSERYQRKGAKGKSKKASSKNELKPPANPALARPPKPPRPNMQRKIEPETEVEVTGDLELETTVTLEE